VKSFAVRSLLHSMHGCAALSSAPGLAAISYLASHLAAHASCHVSLSGHAPAIVRTESASISDESIYLLEVPAAALEHAAADALAV
jgi:hypothetical protein